MTPPAWLSYAPDDWVTSVQDSLSGLDTTSAAWSKSLDGGDTWGAWQTISLQAISGITLPLQLEAETPYERGVLVRFRIRDMAGNEGISYPLAAEHVWMPMLWKGAGG
ncbi:MAG: hypothetical protein A2Y73_01450 [Chloroflexi bacterium RBG_13_56_8]|nr:MAG: hypothetical protein A2Y73_01450 [Chloroflexi bacterium RBG_13_56_8]